MSGSHTRHLGTAGHSGPVEASGPPGLRPARIYPYPAALLCFFPQLNPLRVSDVCVIIGSHSFRMWPEGCEYEAMLSVWVLLMSEELIQVLRPVPRSIWPDPETEHSVSPG